MKKVLTGGLLAVTAMVMLAASADAQSVRYCQRYPDDPACAAGDGYTPPPPPDSGYRPPPPPDGGYRPPPPPDGGYQPPPDGSPYPPRPHKRPPPPDMGYEPGYDNGRYNDGYGRPPRYMRRMGSCQFVGMELRRFGYRNIRAVDCSGQNYKYRAWRGGQRFLIKVNRENGRIYYAIGL